MIDDPASQIQILRLGVNHNLLDFDCGDPDLNDFFLNDSIVYMKQLLSVTYVMERDNKTVLFFSVSNDKISIRDVESSNIWNRFRRKQKFPQRKRLSSYPAVKIGRLGIHRDYQSQHYGRALLDFIKIFFVRNNKTGCRFITVDAYNKPNVLRFYLNNGFDYLTNDSKEPTRLMVFDLAPLAQALLDSID